jgi:hypothetical protein
VGGVARKDYPSLRWLSPYRERWVGRKDHPNAEIHFTSSFTFVMMVSSIFSLHFVGIP